MIVSYANRGGQRAAEQLRDVLSCLKMVVMPEAVGLPLFDVELGPDGALINPARDLGPYSEALRAGIGAVGAWFRGATAVGTLSGATM